MKEKDKYKLQYPSAQIPSRIIYTTQKGDRFTRDGKTYEVTQVLKPIIKGARPKLALKEVEVDDPTTVLPF